MISALIDGFGYGVAGLRWLAKPGVRPYVAVPLLINVLVFSVGIAWLAGFLADAHQAAVAWLPDWLDWLAWLMWPLAMIAVLIVVWTGFTMIANLIGAPFNGMLAERVQAMHAPHLPLDSRPILQEILRAPLAELSKLAYFVLLAVPVLVVTIVPGVNMLAPLAWAVYGAWVLAVEYCDFPMANAGLRPPVQRARLRERRWMTLGYGAGVMLLTVVPGLNLVAMPSAVVGATLMWCDRLAGPAARP